MSAFASDPVLFEDEATGFTFSVPGSQERTFDFASHKSGVAVTMFVNEGEEGIDSFTVFTKTKTDGVDWPALEELKAELLGGLQSTGLFVGDEATLLSEEAPSLYTDAALESKRYRVYLGDDEDSFFLDLHMLWDEENTFFVVTCVDSENESELNGLSHQVIHSIVYP